MWAILTSPWFSQDVIHQEISELWLALWGNVIWFKWKEKKDIKEFSDKIIELVNQIINNWILKFQESWSELTNKRLSENEELYIVDTAKNIFNEMLLKALLLNEWINNIASKNKTNIWDEARLLYIKDMLISYEEKIVWLLKDFSKTKKYNF